MAEFILPLAKSILSILASVEGDNDTGYLADDEIKVAMAAGNDLKIIKDNFIAICAILADAEEKQHTNKAMQSWLKDLKNVAYDIDDLLDEMAYDALQRDVNKGHFWRQTRYYLSTLNLTLSRFDLGRKIRSLREQLVNIVSKQSGFNLTQRPIDAQRVQTNPSYSCKYVNTQTVVGRDEAKEDILNRLVSLDETSALTVLPIVGVGGIGKTALAGLIYSKISNFDIKLWTCVPREFDTEQTLSKIILDYTCGATNMSPGRLLRAKFKELLEGKKYFLLLDDVWVDDVVKWMELKNALDIGKPGSVILITTRIPKVANITGTINPYYLERLPDEVCWPIFYKLASLKGNEPNFSRLCDIGMWIVQKCRGVPIVVKALGGLLRSERSEEKWLEIESMDSLMNLQGEYDVMQVLKQCYVKLPSHLKTYFAYLATFMKDSTYGVYYHTNFTRALGLACGDSLVQNLEDNYYMELLSKLMIQNASISFSGYIVEFKLHDMLHDVAVDVLGEELSVVTKNEINVSESTRHVSLELLKGPSALSGNEYHKKLFVAKKTRFFTVGERGNHVTQSFLENIISNFTCLRILELQNSFIDELPSSIGNLKHLRFLNLISNPIKTLPDTICELLNLQTLYLNDCEQLEELPKRVRRLISLRIFQVTTRQRSLIGTQFNKLHCLQELYLASCKRLTTLWESDDVGRLTSLKILNIQDCVTLTSLPSSMKLLVGLVELTIINCPKLDLEDDDASSLSGLVNLRYFSLRQMPQIKHMPDAIQSATASLQYMVLEECEGLLELPMWFPSFASLLKLVIRGCPHVFRRCDVTSSIEEDYQDYPLIKHVPEIVFDAYSLIKPQ